MERRRPGVPYYALGEMNVYGELVDDPRNGPTRR